MNFSKILWGIITNKWQGSENLQSPGNFAKGGLEMTCKFLYYDSTANTSNIIVVAKREQLKINFLKNQWFFDVLVYLDVREEKFGFFS